MAIELKKINDDLLLCICPDLPKAPVTDLSKAGHTANPAGIPDNGNDSADVAAGAGSIAASALDNGGNIAAASGIRKETAAAEVSEKAQEKENSASPLPRNDNLQLLNNKISADDIVAASRDVRNIFAVLPEGGAYSSPTAAEIFHIAKILKSHGKELNLSRLPQNVQDVLQLALKGGNIPPENTENKSGLFERIGIKSFSFYQDIKRVCQFIREAFGALGRFCIGTAVWRRKDFWFIFGDCSYKAVGIIALVSFLVGLILAFVGALQLRTFGAGIYVASMVAVGMTRIMAAIMVGIIMAGRTGSSYAATLGTMQVNEEIDALKTLGVKIADYLVAPRLISLVLTIPFLTLLADALGILGGAVVGVSFLDLSSSSYWDYSVKALSLKNILVGLFHSVVYGFIISLCGCYEGLNAGRDADSVGKATTGAVVTALVWMIVATGILTVLFEEMGI